MFEDAFPIISTPDVDRALGFYRDLLDGVVEYQFPPEGDPGYVSVRIAGAHLGVGLDPDARPGADGQRFARSGSMPLVATRPSSGCAAPASP